MKYNKHFCNQSHIYQCNHFHNYYYNFPCKMYIHYNTELNNLYIHLKIRSQLMNLSKMYYSQSSMLLYTFHYTWKVW